ncbi:MAG TPA: sigma-70 family RNA polymerase sigma factor [Planctomycetota bacterium]|nr:sigma-70 family RNA polymerase sigma factor [Planctomycetota bacterium]
MGGSHFATTHWSLVLAAAQQDSPASREALATLCEAYWYPLYAYARRRGRSADDAQDLTQSFFAALLEKHFLATADRERGRFRSFLLTAFQRFLSKEHDRAMAQKRGGLRRTLSLDAESGERRYLLEPSHDWTPERVYERRWALTLLERVMARLRQHYADAAKPQLFDGLKVFLAGEGGAPAHRDVAAELGMSEGAVKVAVHRLRRRYRELLRAEVAQTIADPSDVDDELGVLLAALGSREP